MKLLVKIIDITGKCPAYHLGDHIPLEQGYILDPSAPSRVCLHSLASILPYYVAMAKGVTAKSLGLSKGDSTEAYVHCLDPCHITGGGTVLFEISQLSD
jgi:uncharacterized repeat protein (TIGR04076 family)